MIGRKQNNILLLAVLSLLFLGITSEEPFTIYLIGDSTMANKPDPANNPECGWGQVLPLLFTENVIVKNHARNGRSSKSFRDEGLWKVVLDSLQPGDYLFIQFGHNDQKNYDSTRFTNPFTGYRRNLENFVLEAKEKGTNPILFSSLVRRKFNKNGVLIDTHAPYPLVMRKVAEDLAVPFIDMQWLSEKMVLTAGPEKSKEYYLWVEEGVYEKFPAGNQDDTHLSKKGAMEIARLAVQELRHQNIAVSDFLKDE